MAVRVGTNATTLGRTRPDLDAQAHACSLTVAHLAPPRSLRGGASVPTVPMRVLYEDAGDISAHASTSKLYIVGLENTVRAVAATPPCGIVALLLLRTMPVVRYQMPISN